MLKGIYVGRDIRLLHKTALLQHDSKNIDKCIAQFDDRSLPEAFGWHSFDKSEFKAYKLGEKPHATKR